MSRLLGSAHDEGRLTAEEHARRSDAVHAAKPRSDLAALVADLPAKRGVREWIDKARIRDKDREWSARLLAEALAQGRIPATEAEQRTAAVLEAGTGPP